MACCLLYGVISNDDFLSIKPLEMNFSEIWIQNTNIFIQENASENIIYKWRSFCSRLSVLRTT